MCVQHPTRLLHLPGLTDGLQHRPVRLTAEAHRLIEDSGVFRFPHIACYGVDLDDVEEEEVKEAVAAVQMLYTPPSSSSTILKTEGKARSAASLNTVSPSLFSISHKVFGSAWCPCRQDRQKEVNTLLSLFFALFGGWGWGSRLRTHKYMLNNSLSSSRFPFISPSPSPPPNPPQRQRDCCCFVCPAGALISFGAILP